MNRIRQILLECIIHKNAHYMIWKFQKVCGIETKCVGVQKVNESEKFKTSYVIRNRIAYINFALASTAGEEIFGLMPLLFWFAFPVAVTFVTNFVVLLMFGQLLKEWLRLPRPQTEFSECPIAKLDLHFETEFGFPSTHTLSGLLPVVVLLKLLKCGIAVSTTTWIAVIVYAVNVALSRLYYGVHSVIDVVGGFIIGILLLYCLNAVGDPLEGLLYYDSYYSLPIIMTLMILFFMIYPRTIPWSASYGTSAQIFGSWFGAAVSFCFMSSIHDQFLRDFYRTNSFLKVKGSGDPSDGWEWRGDLVADRWYVMLLQMVTGGLIGVAIKLGSKVVMTQLMAALYSNGWIQPREGEKADMFGEVIATSKYYMFEVPVRIVNYALLGWTVIIICPMAWEAMDMIPTELV